jgi:hypothetical protein
MEQRGSDGCPIDQVGGYVAPLDARPYEEEGVRRYSTRSWDDFGLEVEMACGGLRLT